MPQTHVQDFSQPSACSYWKERSWFYFQLLAGNLITLVSCNIIDTWNCVNYTGTLQFRPPERLPNASQLWRGLHFWGSFECKTSHLILTGGPKARLHCTLHSTLQHCRCTKHARRSSVCWYDAGLMQCNLALGPPVSIKWLVLHSNEPQNCRLCHI